MRLPPSPTPLPSPPGELPPGERQAELPASRRPVEAEAAEASSAARAFSLAALALGAAACIGYAAHVASGLGGASVAVILLALALGGAVVACAVAALERSPARNAWRLLALALAAYGLTSITYTVVPNVAGNFPSVYDLGLFAFYPLAFAALIAFVRRRVIGFSAALWIDSIVGAVVVAALGATVIWPLLDGPLGLAVVGQLLFFLGDLGFLGFLLAAYALSGWRDASSLGFLAGGAALLAIADGVWVVDVAGGAAAPGLLPSFLWPAAVLVLAIAPYGQVRAVALSTSTWSTVGIPGASAVACLPIVLLSATDTPQHILGSAALGLVVVRLTISLRDNFRMFATIEEAAITDPLTGLANRKLLLERLDQSLSRQSRLGGMTAVLSLDLDDFKAINDAHGHEFGDEVLVAVGERLAISLRHYDSIARGAATNPRPLQRETIGRLDGDEFVVLLEGLRGPTDAAGVAERILTELRTPLVTGTHEVSLEASTGIAIADDTVARAGSEVLRDADTAMYAAKRAGKGHYEFFEPRMHDAVVARTKLIRDLDGAVENSQLRLLYQPQVDLSSGRMTGVEALVRWQHPQRGLLSPDLFIPAAESTGMIVAIDDWVMREACTQLRAWDDAGVGRLDMAVNVSAGRLVTGDLAESLDSVLRDTGVAAERLEIELTETVAVEEGTNTLAAITRIRELGVRAAIDDFGMGHSALSRLRSFPVDRLKIDRSFVATLSLGAERGSLADVMIAMGHSLGLEVVAEGVETQEHLRALRALGCRSAQGYLFSKPVSAEQIDRLARAGAPLAPPPEDSDARAEDLEPSSLERERLTRNLLAELQRLTGVESTYLTRIDWSESRQHITHARNAGTIDIPEGLTVDWSETICRQALEQGVNYTDDVPATFPNSGAGDVLAPQTYLSVPLVNSEGAIEGTLCGVSSKPVRLGPEATQVMERFGQIITQSLVVTGERQDARS